MDRSREDLDPADDPNWAPSGEVPLAVYQDALRAFRERVGVADGVTGEYESGIYHAVKAAYAAGRVAPITTKGGAAANELFGAIYCLNLEVHPSIPVDIRRLADLALADERRKAREECARLHELIQRFGDAATDTFEQMLKGNWKDDHDHDVRMNKSMLDLKRTVADTIAFRAALTPKEHENG
jgi:hypothetical protein